MARFTGVLAIVFMAACGATTPVNVAVSQTPAAGSSVSAATASPTAAPTRSARPTTAAERDCTVSWRQYYRSLALLADEATVIVRARAIATDTVQLTPGLGPGTFRDARRTTFVVLDTLKGTVSGELRVLEDACPNLTVVPGEEWVLFASRADERNGPGDGREHYLTLGGPQGQFRIRGGLVSGPFYKFADVVHGYEGAPIAELLADLTRVPALDRAGARTMLGDRGWTIQSEARLSDLSLPSGRDSPWRTGTFGDVADAATRGGADLTPYLGRTVQVARFWLEHAPPAAVLYEGTIVLGDGKPVGGWIVVMQDDRWRVFALTERAQALAYGATLATR